MRDLKINQAYYNWYILIVYKNMITRFISPSPFCLALTFTLYNIYSKVRYFIKLSLKNIFSVISDVDTKIYEIELLLLLWYLQKTIRK